MALEVATLEEEPRLLSGIESAHKGGAALAPRMPAFGERADSGRLPAARKLGLHGEGPHLPEEDGVPEALDPDRLLSRDIDLEDELDEEDRITHGQPREAVHDAAHQAVRD